jgi:hypothetical protein
MGTRVLDDSYDDAVELENLMQPWPNLNHAAMERSSEKTFELRSRLKLRGMGSGVKGPDERQKTAPLTPLPTPPPHFALDNADVVRDVNTPYFPKTRPKSSLQTR